MRKQKGFIGWVVLVLFVLFFLLGSIAAIGSAWYAKTQFAGLAPGYFPGGGTGGPIVGSGPAIGQALDVPLIPHSQRGRCGRSSAAMVIAFFTNGRVRLNPDTQLTNTWATHLNKDETGHTWVDGNYAQDNFQGIIAALEKGYPAIIYGQFPNRNGTSSGMYHIMVVTGYDPADKSFWINNAWNGDGIKNQKVSLNFFLTYPYTGGGSEHKYLVPQ